MDKKKQSMPKSKGGAPRNRVEEDMIVQEHVKNTKGMGAPRNAVERDMILQEKANERKTIGGNKMDVEELMSGAADRAAQSVEGYKCGGGVSKNEVWW